MPQKIVSLGELNITFSLELSQIDIENYSINWAQINELKDLSFIKEKSSLWDKIEIQSKDDLIKFLLYMNKINKNKTYIQFITLNKIIYNEEQKKFKYFIEQITNHNYLYITTKEIFNCINNKINIDLFYKNEKKSFSLTNYKNISNDNNNKNKEEKNFIELSNNKNIFNFFDYIFLDQKTIKKDFCNIISFDIFNSFCLNLKKK